MPRSRRVLWNNVNSYLAIMDMDINTLVKKVIDCGFRVHKALTPGYVEEVYRKAMMIELADSELQAKKEVQIPVKYKGHLIGNYYADIIVENRLILELKAVDHITKAFETQLVNYLTATGIDDGLLINFGSELFDARRKYRVYTPQK